MPTNRDLHPTKEAVAAMWLYGAEYASQGSGSMGFWDNLPAPKKRLCKELVDEVLTAPERSDVKERK